MCYTKGKNYSVQSISTPPNSEPLKNTLPLVPVELHKIKQLPLTGKEYLFFHINSKFPHAEQWVKSRIMNTTIDYIPPIDTFEQQCVVMKCML